MVRTIANLPSIFETFPSQPSVNRMGYPVRVGISYEWSNIKRAIVFSFRGGSVSLGEIAKYFPIVCDGIVKGFPGNATVFLCDLNWLKLAVTLRGSKLDG